MNSKINQVEESYLFELELDKVEGGLISKRRRRLGSQRRVSGAFFTPAEVVVFAVNTAFELWKERNMKQQGITDVQKLIELKVLDLAVGSGLFLLGFRQLLRETAPPLARKILLNIQQPENNELSSLITESGILETNATQVDSKWDHWIIRNILWGVDINKQSLKLAESIICHGIECSYLTPHLLNADSLLLPIDSDSGFKGWLSVGEPPIWNIIVGNPPWGTSIPKDGNLPYGNCRDESALAFLVLSKELVSPQGIIAYVLPSAWLQAPSWAQWREKNLNQIKPLKICILPYRTFPDATFTAPPILGFFNESYGDRLICSKLLLPQASTMSLPKGQLVPEWYPLLNKCAEEIIYALESDFLKHTPSFRIPIASEWWVKNLYSQNGKTSGERIFSPLSSLIMKCVRGVKTGNNAKYIKEYKQKEDLVEFSNQYATTGFPTDKPTWTWLAKGGKTQREGRPLYFIQPISHIIRWDAPAVQAYAKNNGLRNAVYYGCSGIGFASSGQYSPIFRIVEGLVFDADYIVLITKRKEDIKWLVAILNSPVAIYAAKHLYNHSTHFKSADVLDMPIPEVSYDEKEILSSYTDTIIRNLNQTNVAKELKAFSNIHNLVCEIYGLPDREKRRCEQWYATRFPGFRVLFPAPL